MKFEFWPFFKFNHLKGRWGSPDHCRLSFNVNLWGFVWVPFLRYLHTPGDLILSLCWGWFVLQLDVCDNAFAEGKQIKKAVDSIRKEME